MRQSKNNMHESVMREFPLMQTIYTFDTYTQGSLWYLDVPDILLKKDPVLVGNFNFILDTFHFR